MKKSVNNLKESKFNSRLIILTLIIISLLLLTSCGQRVPGGEEPIDTATALKMVQTGTQGIELYLLPNQPPAYIYDQNELVALVEVRNRGNYDLDPEYCFVQVTGFDTNIIKGGLDIPKSCAENIGTLQGKNVYNVEGSTNLLEFRSPSVTLPLNVFDYNPTLNFVACYNYHTKANPQVCVDPLFYQVTAEQKTCIPQNVGMAGGQGAPVGVSYVGVDMIGDAAVFEINVVNYGQGRVLSPYSDIQNCGKASLEYTDLDKVGFNVQLSGGNLIDCKPMDKFVRLTNNNGKIICRFSIPVTSAFETPLMIDLDYNYIESTQKQIQIVKTPQ
ncbi:MAG TPA: hypothetical protein VJA23_06180 [Candidatus Nanoarchaeia archaeon]|nr:hypothetical protein [Candidatus Nanoarchaeia archaeon]